MKDYDAIVFGGLPRDLSGRSLGLFRLRTACEKLGYNIKIIDYVWGLNESQIANLLEKFVGPRTRIIGFSTLWGQKNTELAYTNDRFLAALKIKYKHCKIVAGGANDSIRNKLWLKYADFYVTGFGDISFAKLLDKLNEKESDLIYWKLPKGPYIINSDTHYVVKNTDEIETILHPEDNFKSFQPIPIEISRGCIFKCSFCSFPFLGKKDYDYIRSPQSIASELRRNYELFGTTRYCVTDDTFNDSLEKLNRLEQGIELSGIPKFEFVCFLKPELVVTKPEMLPKLMNLNYRGGHLGIESLINSARKTVGKGLDIEKILDACRKLNEMGAQNHASFIVGLPTESLESVYRTNDYLASQNFKLFHSWIFYGLNMHVKVDGTAASEFSSAPEKYGFTIRENKDMLPWLDWVNDQGLDVHAAANVANTLNENIPNMKIAGWSIPSAWHNNLSDDQIKTFKNHEAKQFREIDNLVEKRLYNSYNRDINS